MWTKLTGAAAMAAIIALASTHQALAVCNPGTAHCITDGGPAGALARAKAQINQGKGNTNCDPGPMGACSDDLPSGSDSASAAQKAPAKPIAPVIQPGTVTVAPSAD